MKFPALRRDDSANADGSRSIDKSELASGLLSAIYLIKSIFHMIANNPLDFVFRAQNNRNPLM